MINLLKTSLFMPISMFFILFMAAPLFHGEANAWAGSNDMKIVPARVVINYNRGFHHRRHHPRGFYHYRYRTPGYSYYYYDPYYYHYKPYHRPYYRHHPYRRHGGSLHFRIRIK